MKLVFYVAPEHRFDATLSRAFRAGCKQAGQPCRIVPTTDWQNDTDADVAISIGVKDQSGPITRWYLERGRQVVCLDKGYVRLKSEIIGTLYWRVSVNAFQPLEYFQKIPRPPDRWLAAYKERWNPLQRGNNILFAGSSQKFCNLHGLGDGTVYAQSVIDQIRQVTDRPIVYRPKPTWRDAVPIKGTRFSTPKNKFPHELSDCYALVTYGSNACFEAALAGIPSIVLGNGITRPISGTQIADLPTLQVPDPFKVQQLAQDLAYCQWTLAEMESGEVWAYLQTILRT